MATSLDEIKILSGIPLHEVKMPPRSKETMHKAARGHATFILAPVQVRTEYPEKGGQKITWKAVKKGSAKDNDWLVKTRSGKPIAIVSYDESGGEWNLQRLKGKEVSASVAASNKDLAKVLDDA
jgi:hypothetical protein